MTARGADFFEKSGVEAFVFTDGVTRGGSGPGRRLCLGKNLWEPEQNISDTIEIAKKVAEREVELKWPSASRLRWSCYTSP